MTVDTSRAMLTPILLPVTVSTAHPRLIRIFILVKLQQIIVVIAEL